MYNIFWKNDVLLCLGFLGGEGGGGLVCDAVYSVFSFSLDAKYSLGHRIDKKTFYGVLFLSIQMKLELPYEYVGVKRIEFKVL